MNVPTSSLALSLLLVSTSAAAAVSDDVIEEIVVYGELREAPLAELPGSISVVDENTIERRHAQHLEQILLLIRAGLI